MKVLSNVVLTILVFLAVSSGVTKVMLLEQDVEFFSQYGFTNPLLIFFGAIQLIGGLLMVFNKLRGVGAILVAITLLILAKKWMAMGFTVVAIMLLGMVIVRTLKTSTAQSD
jgi:hypothetical protein